MKRWWKRRLKELRLWGCIFDFHGKAVGGCDIALFVNKGTGERHARYRSYMKCSICGQELRDETQ